MGSMIPKWLWGKTIAVYDLETDNIPTTKIYMMGVAIIIIDNTGVVSTIPSKVFTYTWTPYSKGSLLQGISLIVSCDYHAGFNSVGFDDQEVAKHLSIQLNDKHLDAMILSKIIFSKDDLFSIDASLGLDKDLWGSYSLKAFGQRLGDFKLDFHSFDEMTEEMAIYCNQDTNLTVQLLLFLLEKENFPLEAVVDIEHKAAAIIAEQSIMGFYIDIEKTRALNTKLLTEKLDLSTQLSEIFAPKWLKDGTEKTYKKKSVVRKYLPNKHYKPLLGTPHD